MGRTRSTRGEVKDRLSALGEVAGRFERWRPGTEVLTRVTSQKTIFPVLNRKTRVNGWPNQRISLLHGPSAHGKTELMMGLGASYLMGGHFYLHIDAEFTTPEDWVRKLMLQHATSPGFRALRPKSYEETTEAVRDAAIKIVEAKKEGILPPDVACCIGVDSIRKLVPDKLWEKLAKDDGGIDGMNGRAAQYKAALNAQWLDELVPLAHNSNLSIIIIAREMEQQQTNKWDPDFKVAGGKALVFESSLVCRVMRDGYVYADAEKKHLIGERHGVQISKSKIAGKDERTVEAYFHTSNGKMNPEGFDRPRDVVTLAAELGIIEQKGSSYMYSGKRLGIGTNAAVSALWKDADLLEEIEGKLELGEGEEP